MMQNDGVELKNESPREHDNRAAVQAMKDGATLSDEMSNFKISVITNRGE